MTILAAGGEHIAFVWPSTQPTSANWSTTAALFDSAYCSGAIVQSGTSMIARAPFASTNQSEVWVHLQEFYTTTNGSSAVPFITLYNASGQGVLRLYQSSLTVRRLQYWNGTAWTDIGSTFSMTSGARASIDIYCKIADSGGEFSIYVDSVLKATLTGDTNLFSGSEVSYVEISPTHSTNSANQGWSQLICSTTDTRLMKLSTLRPSGAGSSSDWAGAYTDVDDVGFANDADYITSGTANQISTFALSDLSTEAQALTPLAIVATGRGRRGSTGPQNVQLAIRTGGTVYAAANDPNIGASFGNFTQRVWDVNPNTSAAWTLSDVQALEAGVKSIT